MDVENSLKSSKCKKNSSMIKIDAIPEEILGEIISFLPLKDAVRTSILAKKWKDLWKAMTKIEVKEKKFKNRPQFRDFMDKLLTLSNSRIRKFSFKCEVRKDTPKVNQWLAGIITPTVQELKLRFGEVHEQLAFPDHLFTSQSLTHLCLYMPHVINLPSAIHFPNLKSLTLKDVTFPDTPRTQQLFAGCPSLEELELIDCIWVNVRAVRIVCPLLQSLIIREWRDFNALFQNVYLLEFCAIDICESNNLKKFSYDGDLLNSYYLSSTSATDATLEANEPPPNSILDPDHFVFNFLLAFSNVEKLSISDYVIELLCHSPQIVKVLPWYNNLVELHVGFPEPVNLACSAMQTLLRHAPNLETLEFPKGVILCTSCVDKIDPMPVCFITRVETIRICEFGGAVEEMTALKYLVERALVLDELYVRVGYQYNGEEGKKRLQELWEEMLSFPRASEIRSISLE